MSSSLADLKLLVFGCIMCTECYCCHVQPYQEHQGRVSRRHGAAIGQAEFVKGDWVKLGACVIDVGVNFKDDPSRKWPTNVW